MGSETLQCHPCLGSFARPGADVESRLGEPWWHGKDTSRPFGGGAIDEPPDRLRSGRTWRNFHIPRSRRRYRGQPGLSGPRGSNRRPIRSYRESRPPFLPGRGRNFGRSSSGVAGEVLTGARFRDQNQSLHFGAGAARVSPAECSDVPAWAMLMSDGLPAPDQSRAPLKSRPGALKVP